MVGTSNLGSWNGHWIYECSNHSNQCLTVVHLTWWPGLSIDDVLMPMETLPRPPGSPTLKQPEDENTGGSRSDFD